MGVVGTESVDHAQLADGQAMTDQKTQAYEFNAKIIEEFRANEGRVGGAWRAPR